MILIILLITWWIQHTLFLHKLRSIVIYRQKILQMLWTVKLQTGLEIKHVSCCVLDCEMVNKSIQLNAGVNPCVNNHNVKESKCWKYYKILIGILIWIQKVICEHSLLWRVYKKWITHIIFLFPGIFILYLVIANAWL